MIQWLAILLLLLLSVVSPSSALLPNIITILTDDQGFGDASFNCENTTGYCPRTPNLDYLATSQNSAYFHRFYAAAGVCSPTRAALLTGRTNERSCIFNALTCDSENPAPSCSMGKGLPWSEFTTADAAKKAGHNTVMIGKWHLGDLWAKTDVPGYAGNYSSPSQHGFDYWIQTEAEASNSMPNCGCFPVNHTHPGPKPPSGYDLITPHGDQCVVGGGHPSDWCYPCTNYYTPNATDSRGVSEWIEKIPGNDATFIVDQFAKFLDKSLSENKKFYAHLTFHAIHEPHPAMPEFYAMYQHDPDYLGALTMFDVELGRLINLLREKKVYNNTIILYTADNGPHQGKERTDIRYSTSYLRQCKASMFEGGLRVPGIIHSPQLINHFVNITTPVFSQDFLPTIMSMLHVDSDHPEWSMDGISLMPYLNHVLQYNVSLPRPSDTPLIFKWGTAEALIDNNWKLLSGSKRDFQGQCDFQKPYSLFQKFDEYYLFNLGEDYHELHDQKMNEPDRYNAMVKTLENLKASIVESQQKETGCGIE